MGSQCTTGSNAAAPLKLVVLLDRNPLDAWKQRTIQRLSGCDFLDLTIVRLNREKKRPHPGWWPYLLYEAFDRMLFARSSRILDACRKVNPDSLARLPGIKVMDLDAGGRSPDPRLLSRLAGCDVAFDLADAPLDPDWLYLPRYGTWALSHRDHRRYFEGPPFFWEMHDGGSLLGTTLVIRGRARARDKVIYRSYAKAHPYSLFLSRNAAYWKSTEFATRRLRDLHRYGWNYIRSLDTYAEKQEPLPKGRCMPGLSDLAVFFAGIAGRFVMDKRDKWPNHYQFALACKPNSHDFRGNALTDFQVIVPPRSEFWADPFLYKAKDNRHYLFFESYGYRDKKGVISYLQLPCKEGQLIPELALERDYHLSYPFLFEHGGELYMLPETSANRTVELYRAVEFPKRWQLEKVLLSDVDAHDATLFETDGKFWLFVNMAVSGGSINDELFLFYADSLWGGWTPHPKNPIISDVSRARPAGRLFYQDGRLIRPSQDCSKRYGYALNFNHVEVLSETDYRESPAHRLTPEGFGDYRGLHTYNADDAYEVIDVGRYISNRYPRTQAVQHLPLPPCGIPGETPTDLSLKGA